MTTILTGFYLIIGLIGIMFGTTVAVLSFRHAKRIKSIRAAVLGVVGTLFVVLTPFVIADKLHELDKTQQAQDEQRSKPITAAANGEISSIAPPKEWYS